MLFISSGLSGNTLPGFPPELDNRLLAASHKPVRKFAASEGRFGSDKATAAAGPRRVAPAFARAPPAPPPAGRATVLSVTAAASVPARSAAASPTSSGVPSRLLRPWPDESPAPTGPPPQSPYRSAPPPYPIGSRLSHRPWAGS